MLLADSHITMVVGVDVHVTTTPPFNPIHPYIGMVLDPADYIPFLGTNGQPDLLCGHEYQLLWGTGHQTTHLQAERPGLGPGKKGHLPLRIRNG